MTTKEHILYIEQKLSDIEDIVSDIKDIVTDLKNMQFGNWEVKDNQMLFYDLDGNLLTVYNLYNKKGKPSEVNVYKREMTDG